MQKNRNNLGENPQNLFVELQDCFIYGVNPDQQAAILLYGQVKGSLLLTADFRRKGCQKGNKECRFQENDYIV